MIDGHGDIHIMLTSKARLFDLQTKHKNIPFICLEPWMSMGDKDSFQGMFKDKKNVNMVEVGQEVKFDYSITI